MRPAVQPFRGEHCETVALGTLLRAMGMELPESSLFGLGRGLGFFTTEDSLMHMPMLAGRIAPGAIFENASKALDLQVCSLEGEGEAAWEVLVQALRNGMLPAVQLDCYPLGYFRSKVHFAGHWVAVLGFDGERVWLADTEAQGGLCQTSRSAFLEAWGASPALPLARPWRGLILQGEPVLRAGMERNALTANAKQYLSEAAPAMLAAVGKLPQWLRSEQGRADAARAAILMERAGTGGANFRRLFSTFVARVVPEEAVRWVAVTQQWKLFSELLHAYGESGLEERADEAVQCFETLCEAECLAMRRLSPDGTD